VEINWKVTNKWFSEDNHEIKVLGDKYPANLYLKSPFDPKTLGSNDITTDYVAYIFFYKNTLKIRLDILFSYSDWQSSLLGLRAILSGYKNISSTRFAYGCDIIVFVQSDLSEDRLESHKKVVF